MIPHGTVERIQVHRTHCLEMRITRGGARRSLQVVSESQIRTVVCKAKKVFERWAVLCDALGQCEIHLTYVEVCLHSKHASL